MAYMYILECVGKRLYVGSTRNLDKRFTQHLSGEGSKFTARFPPIRIAYYEEFLRVSDAFYREHQVKNWSRKKKLALINQEKTSLVVLAKKEFP